MLAKSKAIFEFVEGPLVTALRRGHWYVIPANVESTYIDESQDLVG